MNIKTRMRSYIHEELLADDVEIEDDELLLSDGLVDSLGMMRLVAFLEELTDREIPPEHLTIEHFRSIETICRYLELPA